MTGKHRRKMIALPARRPQLTVARLVRSADGDLTIPELAARRRDQTTTEKEAAE